MPPATSPAAKSPGTVAAVESASTRTDRKSTRLNSSHSQISYAVFCLKKKKIISTVRLFESLVSDIVQPTTYVLLCETINFWSSSKAASSITSEGVTLYINMYKTGHH